MACFRQFDFQRKKVEALFAELKNQIGLRRLRRIKFGRKRFFLGSGGAEHQAPGAVSHSDDNMSTSTSMTLS
jgi:hypothetical protein